MTKLSSACTLIEVSSALGYYCSPIKLSELVKHPNLNMYSECKPIYHVGTLPADEAGFKAAMASARYGIEMTSVTGTTDEGMWSDTIAESKGNPWVYTGVTVTRDYPGRLSDFRWYNQEAECPYNPVELYYYVPGLEETKGPVMQLKFSLNTSPNVEIDPYKVSTLHGTYEILCQKVGTNNSFLVASAAVSTAFTELTSERIQLTSAQTGDYEACAAIHRGGGDQEYYPLPNSYIRFNLRNFSKEEYCHLQLANQCKIEMGSTVGQLTVKMQLRNISDDPITATCTCFVYDSRNENLFYNTGTTFTIPARQILIVYGNENNQLVTTDPGPIRIENIGPSETWRPPLTARVTGKNNWYNDCVITKEVVILQ